MIGLLEATLGGSAGNTLVRWQRLVSNESSHSGRVLAAKKLWKSRNRVGSATFDEVKGRLIILCSGARRCCYCEDSYADEVEHVWPKSLYPERAFQWENYLYVCGACNVPKSNRFALYCRKGVL